MMHEQDYIMRIVSNLIKFLSEIIFGESNASYKLSEDEYFYCLCISKIYSRGIDSALAKYFGKHKSFLKNSIKSKTGKAKRAYDRFLNTSYNEILKIGEEKFYECGIQKYSKTKLNILTE